MPKYSLKLRAEKDLAEIWSYIARDNPEAAARVVKAAYETFDVLAAAPGMGKLRLSTKSPVGEVRSLPVARFKKYLVFYRPAKDGIHILRVYHVARDIEALFDK